MTTQDYELLLNLMEKAIRNKIKWLRTQKDANFALFNAGQIHAYHDVLNMFVNEPSDKKKVLG